MKWPAACLLLTCLAAPRSLHALEHVTWRRGERQQSASGQIVVEAQDGGLLLMATDGAMWNIEPDQIISRKQDDEAFHLLSREELARQLLAELPPGFAVHHTHHYLICYNTSREYAAWCGALFERLEKAFISFWDYKGIKLHEPKAPLVAIIFDSRASYAKFSAAELGNLGEPPVGYYSFGTNRITMYDLTGIESLRTAGARRGSAAQINLILSRPEAELVVATVIHEATHQIAFNSGMQTRFADIPIWVSEGLAMFFETPDLQSAKGWRNIGSVNGNRLDHFREYAAKRPAGSLKQLLTDDTRFRDTRQALDAYAEAWALNYYLIRRHERQYVAYLQKLAQKEPARTDDPQTRLTEFQEAFGENLGKLETDFLRQMQKVR